MTMNEHPSSEHLTARHDDAVSYYALVERARRLGLDPRAYKTVSALRAAVAA